MNLFFIKRGALSPVLPFSFTQGLSARPINLTGRTVSLSLRAVQSTTNLLSGAPCTVTSPVAPDADGKQGYYGWQSGDTDVEGRYHVEWDIDGQLFLPVDGFDTVVIVPSLQ